LACGIGLGIGQYDGTITAIERTSVGNTNILVAIGLILMMYPPLAKVNWAKAHLVFQNRSLIILSLVLNWVIGPMLMYLLAVAFFGQEDRFSGYMSGLSLVGCARCIAMVLIWNLLSGGDNEYCATLVAINSIVTIVLYAPLSIFYIEVLPKAMNVNVSDTVDVQFEEVVSNVAIYMGIPFFAGILTYFTLTKLHGKEWYFGQFCPKIGPLALLALLFTIIFLFASKSTTIVNNIGFVLYAIVPLLIYFFSMFGISFGAAYALNATYAQAVTVAFTAASNNFELALAIAIASFTLNSDEALMSVVGALIEIPTMLALVHLCHWLKRHVYQLTDEDDEDEDEDDDDDVGGLELSNNNHNDDEERAGSADPFNHKDDDDAEVDMNTISTLLVVKQTKQTDSW